MPCPLLISSQSDYLIRVFDRNSHIKWQTVNIQICWLFQKPTDLDLHCLLRQGMLCLARERLTVSSWCSFKIKQVLLGICHWYQFFNYLVVFLDVTDALLYNNFTAVSGGWEGDQKIFLWLPILSRAMLMLAENLIGLKTVASLQGFSEVCKCEWFPQSQIKDFRQKDQRKYRKYKMYVDWTKRYT